MFTATTLRRDDVNGAAARRYTFTTAIYDRDAIGTTNVARAAPTSGCAYVRAANGGRSSPSLSLGHADRQPRGRRHSLVVAENDELLLF